MTPLRVALVVKQSQSTRAREDRNMGWWSYPVPEFEWEHYDLYEASCVDLKKFGKFDFVFVEDANKGVDLRHWGLPVAFLSFDDTLSDEHLATRLEQAKLSDLVLVDHGPLARFRPAGKPVLRLNYCVNDHVFKPLEKTLDVSFHCAGGGHNRGTPGWQERAAIRSQIDTIAKQSGYSYRSGVLGLAEYAESMGRSRVIVNWPRTVLNRPHRVFDAMACGAALLTGPIPSVTGDWIDAGAHYRQFTGGEELSAGLFRLLYGGEWEAIAKAGRDLVIERHTWAIRARELRAIISERFGL